MDALLLSLSTTFSRLPFLCLEKGNRTPDFLPGGVPRNLNTIPAFSFFSFVYVALSRIWLDIFQDLWLSSLIGD